MPPRKRATSSRAAKNAQRNAPKAAEQTQLEADTEAAEEPTAEAVDAPAVDDVPEVQVEEPTSSDDGLTPAEILAGVHEQSDAMQTAAAELPTGDEARADMEGYAQFRREEVADLEHLLGVAASEESGVHVEVQLPAMREEAGPTEDDDGAHTQWADGEVELADDADFVPNGTGRGTPPEEAPETTGDSQPPGDYAPATGEDDVVLLPSVEEEAVRVEADRLATELADQHLQVEADAEAEAALANGEHPGPVLAEAAAETAGMDPDLQAALEEALAAGQQPDPFDADGGLGGVSAPAAPEPRQEDTAPPPAFAPVITARTKKEREGVVGQIRTTRAAATPRATVPDGPDIAIDLGPAELAIALSTMARHGWREFDVWGVKLLTPFDYESGQALPDPVVMSAKRWTKVADALGERSKRIAKDNRKVPGEAEAVDALRVKIAAAAFREAVVEATTDAPAPAPAEA